MSAERLHQVEELYHAAREQPAEARAAFLESACGDDDALRDEVRSLLGHADSVAGFLERPPHAAMEPEDGRPFAAGARLGSLRYLIESASGSPSQMIGSKLAHYEITSHLGSGGMGDVYQATDSKLGRSVAIKFLPEAFSHDAERVARFEREARVLASLNHPNIAAIYGLEESGVRKFLVMELVPGETLAERIKRGPLPIVEALPIAKQIVEGLEAAHEKGVIHRDLKPANIKVTPQGQVKVLDFGLAKAFAGEAAGMNLSNSPTLSMAATSAGVILGTAAYMSPEQAKGKETDRATDIWAFGCVLYEMLTGRTAFEGESLGEVLGSVFKAEPDWSLLSADTPESIRRLLRRCLRKEERLRLRDMRDARIEIDEASGEPQSSALSPRPTQRRERILLLALFAMTLIAAAAMVWALRPVPFASEVRLEITTPPTTDPASFAISPDGQKIVFVATREGRSRLWLRSLDSSSMQPLPGTDFAAFPFWSADSRSVGFFAESKLKRIDLEGASVRILADTTAGGGTWSNGMILFGTNNSGRGIFRISANGGEPTAATLADAGNNHSVPRFLPDGRHFLYLASGSIYVADLDTPSTRRLLEADGGAAYLASGQLLFVRQRTLFAQPFDTVRLDLTGDPIPLAQGVDPAFSASVAGSIVYRAASGEGQRQLIWFDRVGKEIRKVGGWDPGLSAQLTSLSPDGRLVGVVRTVSGVRSLWLLDSDSGAPSRFTFEPGGPTAPVWSPDGKRIAFGTTKKKVRDIYVKLATGAGGEELLLETGQPKQPQDWSPDGRFLLFDSNEQGRGYDLWALPMNGDRTPFPVIHTRYDEAGGQFSPDGRWLGYHSNESGRYEIYVQPFPGPGGKWQISTDGGTQVRWSRNGKELFYVAPDGKLMAVPITISSDSQTVLAGRSVPLFETRIGGAVGQSGITNHLYTVARDGQRFLMNTFTEEASSPIMVILNWRFKP